MKNNVNNFLTVCIILLVVGILIIFNAANIGESMGSIAIQSNGGMLMTERYNDIVYTNITAFQLVGLVCSLISGIGILLSYFHKAIELDNKEIEKQEILNN